MRSFEVTCPNPGCRCVLSVPEKLRGLCVQCSKCGERFVTPLSAHVFLAAFGPRPPKRKAG